VTSSKRKQKYYIYISQSFLANSALIAGNDLCEVFGRIKRQQIGLVLPFIWKESTLCVARCRKFANVSLMGIFKLFYLGFGHCHFVAWSE